MLLLEQAARLPLQAVDTADVEFRHALCISLRFDVNLPRTQSQCLLPAASSFGSSRACTAFHAPSLRTREWCFRSSWGHSLTAALLLFLDVYYPGLLDEAPGAYARRNVSFKLNPRSVLTPDEYYREDCNRILGDKVCRHYE